MPEFHLVCRRFFLSLMLVYSNECQSLIWFADVFFVTYAHLAMPEYHLGLLTFFSGLFLGLLRREEERDGQFFRTHASFEGLSL